MRSTLTALALLLTLPACRNKDVVPDTGAIADSVDADGDGAPASVDCDDEDPEINPDAEELCDEVDNDCDGEIDEGVTSTFYADGDGDGHGDPDAPLEACDLPEGAAETGEDCDDSDPAYHPGAPEEDCADPNDYNCDGSVGYADNDGDGWAACEECDDGEAGVNPDAVEVCDDVDNDCDGDVDDDDEGLDTSTADTWYSDDDGDGYGDPAAATLACEAPSGAVADAGDCDDGDAAVNPDAVEVCDAVDNDCDGLIDDADDSLDAASATTWYSDNDGDGEGDPDSASLSCDAPSGAVADASDCDDGDAAINSAALEVCDEVDNDCDGLVDDADDSLDASTGSTWYSDNDGDGVGDSDADIQACDQPSGAVAAGGDCDDDDATAYPGATEVCDEVDNDCDGDTDEEVTSTFYADADGDGYGAAAYTQQACSAPSGYVADGTDCDDGEATINPAGTETCNEEDDDCDGDVDEGVTSEWYLDADGDGYGADSSAVEGCEAPTSVYVADGGDCDDGDTAYSPGASEGCDGEDYDCDGDVDNDADGDGYADSSCGGDDCDDSDASIYPDTSGDCALGVSCDDVLSKGYSSGDGLYTIDPDGYSSGEDPEEVYCDMSSYGGGWTLIAVNDPSSSSLTTTTVVDDSTFGSPTRREEYKALAWSTMAFADLMFTDGSSTAVYEGVDGGSQSWDAFQAAVPLHNCGSTDGYNYAMTDGDLSGSSLCDTDLYVHPIDEDGGSNSSCSSTYTWANNAYGPAWSASNNNGCPLDDVSGTSFLLPGTRAGWDSSAALEMYAR